MKFKDKQKKKLEQVVEEAPGLPEDIENQLDLLRTVDYNQDKIPDD